MWSHQQGNNMTSRFVQYLNEEFQSKEGKAAEEKYRKSQMEVSMANFYDMFAEKAERDMIKEFEISIESTIKRMKQKGMFK